MSARILVGSPEELAAEVEGIVATGLDGIILNFPANGADADAVAAAGRAIRAAL
jgi:alkanesulfonate monooxygenase SsuD/methylene tetrahydromethanopterin reductase-like flavin-dependent oxidoreductase (luciferase family)